MFRRSSRILLLFLAAVIMGLALVAGGLVWKLGRGPISLGFLTPVIEQALATGDESSRIRLHDTVLTWEGKDQALDIRAVGLELVDQAGRVQASVPQMSVRFSSRALLRGLIAPASLEFHGPRLVIVRDEDGDVTVGHGTGVDGPDGGGAAGGPADLSLVEELLRAPDPDRATGYLTRVAVESAYVELVDHQLGITMVAPRVDVALERDEAGIAAEGSLTLAQGDDTLRVDLSGLYRSDSGASEFGAAFEGVRPASLTVLHPDLAPAGRLDMPLDGTLALSFDAGFSLQTAGLDLAGGAGTADMADLGLPPLEMAGFAVQLRASDGLRHIVMDSLLLDLGGPLVMATAEGTRDDGTVDFGVQAEIEGLPADDIARYWPPEAEPNAREWITENVRDGVMERASLSLSGHFPEAAPEAFTLESMGGEIQAANVTLHYLRPMEPIRGVNGRATFDEKAFLIDVEGGSVRGLVAESGRIEILGLDGPPRGETIRIEAQAAGPVRDALSILDEEPLGFVSRLGIDPARTSGSQRTNLVIAFPLLDAIKVDEIAVAAAARLEDFRAENAFFGLPVEDGDFTLNVDRKGLKATGTAQLSGVSTELTWTENFDDDEPVRSRYEVRAVLDGTARAAFGAELAPWLTGPAGVGMTYVSNRNGTGVGAVDIDLAQADLALDDFGWRKPAGVPGRAFARFLVEDEALTAFPEFRATSQDLSVEGSAVLRREDDGSALHRLSFDRLAFGGTDLFATVDFPRDGPILITAGGQSLDLRRPLEEMFEAGEDTGEEGEEDGLPALRVTIAENAPLQRVRLGEETQLAGVRGHFARDGEDWRDVEMRADLLDAGRLYLRLEPVDGNRRLTLESDDAGGVLRAIDWVDTIRGGDMRVRADFLDQASEGALAGQLAMQDFVLTEEPLAAKILALASLSGIADVLGGQGITFRRAEVPFEIRDDRILIKGAKARGADIGVLASGHIDRASDILDIEGEIAPAYTLNSILANIPLLGTVLSGGAEDGIFAATFSARGPVDDPDVSVNPLAVLTPGIIRRLFTGFREDGESPSAQPAPEQAPEARPAPQQ